MAVYEADVIDRCHGFLHRHIINTTGCGINDDFPALFIIWGLTAPGHFYLDDLPFDRIFYNNDGSGMLILTEDDGAVKLHSLARAACIRFKGKRTHRLTFGNKVPLSLGASLAHEKKAEGGDLHGNKYDD